MFPYFLSISLRLALSLSLCIFVLLVSLSFFLRPLCVVLRFPLFFLFLCFSLLVFSLFSQVRLLFPCFRSCSLFFFVLFSAPFLFCFGSSSLTLRFFSGSRPFVAFSSFYKARGRPLFMCLCLTIVRHERLCFFEKKQGNKSLLFWTFVSSHCRFSSGFYFLWFVFSVNSLSVPLFPVLLWLFIGLESLQNKPIPFTVLHLQDYLINPREGSWARDVVRDSDRNHCNFSNSPVESG